MVLGFFDLKSERLKTAFGAAGQGGCTLVNERWPNRFAQLLDHLPSYEFQKCVTRYRGDYQQKTFSCWDQYLAMAFAQLIYRDILRDIEACLRSMQAELCRCLFPWARFRAYRSQRNVQDAGNFLHRPAAWSMGSSDQNRPGAGQILQIDVPCDDH